MWKKNYKICHVSKPTLVWNGWQRREGKAVKKWKEGWSSIVRLESYSSSTNFTTFSTTILCERLWLIVCYFYMDLLFLFTIHNFSYQSCDKVVAQKVMVLNFIFVSRKKKSLIWTIFSTTSNLDRNDKKCVMERLAVQYWIHLLKKKKD